MIAPRPLVAACAALSLLVPPARAADGLERVFPPKPLAFATVDDVTAFVDALGHGAWGRLLQDAACDGLRAAFAEARASGGDAFLQATGIDLDLALSALGGRVGFAVLAAADPERQDFDPEDELPFSFGVVADVSGDVDAFVDAFDAFVDRMIEESDGLVLKTERWGEVDAGVVVDERERTLRYAFVDGHLVATFNGPLLEDRDDFGALVDGVLGRADEALADDPAFGVSVAAAPALGLRATFDVAAFARLGAALDPDLAEALDEALEAFEGTVGLAGLVVEAGDAGLEVSFEWRRPTPEEELALVLDQRPVAAGWMPPTVRGAIAMQIDWAAYYDQVLGGLMKEDPDMAREMIAGMGEFEDEYGFHPRDDLVENLDGQTGLFLAEVDEDERLPLPDDDVPPFNVALVAGLHDGEALRTVVDGVVRKTGMHAARRTEEFEGHTIEFVLLPGISGLAWSITDELVVVSAAPSLVRDVLRRQGESRLESLATSSDWKAASARVPERRAFELAFRAADAGRLALFVLGEFQDEQEWRAKQLPDAEPGPLVGVTLPDVAVVARYLQGMGLLTASGDSEGSLVRIALP